LARYDAGRRLVIDPLLLYSRYLSVSGGDQGYGIAVDGSGNAYVTGHAQSTGFPTVNPLQAVSGGGWVDAFITKINSIGSTLLYSTYQGGGDFAQGLAIAVNGSGNAYVTGERSGGDAFVAAISGNSPTAASPAIRQ
jgi:hypothetical protein